MCRKGTTWTRWIAVASLAVGGLWAQAVPQWRRVGNEAVDVALAGPATGAVDAVWYSADGSRLYARTHAGSTFETADFEHWTASPAAPPPPAVAPVAVDHLPAANITRILPASAPGRVFALGRDVLRSDDYGQSWINLTAYRTESIIGPQQHSLAVSPNDPDQVVVANDYGVWRSLDGGLSWSGLNQWLPNLAAGRILATPDGAQGTRIVVDRFGPVEWQPGTPAGWIPLDPAIVSPDAETRRAYSAAIGSRVTSFAASGDTVYAGTADGYVFLSVDRGRTFKGTNQAASFGGPVESLFADGAVALAAVAGPGGRIFRTTNGGVFWDDLSEKLPPGAAHGVAADRAAGAVYLATDAGVFYAQVDLQGASQAAPAWTSLTPQIAGAAIRARDVKLDPAGNQLYITLDGYGVLAAAAPHRARIVRLVNAADYSNRPAAPGSLVSVLGAQISSARGGDLNFPVLEAGAEESQIQVPFEATGPTVPLALDAAGRRLTIGLPVQPVSPAIFVGRDGEPMIQDADSGLMLDPRNAAHSNARIQIFATGLGKVRPDWPTGMAAPVDQPLPVVAASVRAYLDRAPMQVTSATLAPGYVGLYLVELQLPAIVNSGPAELYISADGQESNRVRIYLEP